MAKTPKSPRQFIFIDDSGDPGISLTKGASRYFIISAISFSSQNDLELATQEISNLRKRLHWQPEREFKFHRASGNVKTKFFDIIRSFNFNASITVVDKSEVKSLPSDLYNHTILKSLLNLPISYANIYIDGKSGKSYQKKLRKL